MTAAIPLDLPEPTFVETLDHIPVISNVSGTVRGLFGIVETIVGIPAFPIQLIGRAMNIRHSFLIVQGISNCVRAAFAQTFIVGNVALYLYDHSKLTKHDFQKAAGIII